MGVMNIARAAEGVGRVGRHGRRRAATRAALIQAAQQLIAEGRTDVSIATITERADVGFGSFYNHFATKEQLFSEAFAEAMDGFSLSLGRLIEDVADMARAVSIGFRIIGRVAQIAPGFASLVTQSGVATLQFGGSLHQASVDLIERGIRAGRFSLPNADVAYSAIGGALLGVVSYLLSESDEDMGAQIDALAVGALRLLGLADEEARLIAHEELPEFVPDESLAALAERLKQPGPAQAEPEGSA